MPIVGDATATLQLLVFFFFAVLCLHPRDALPEPLPEHFPGPSPVQPITARMPACPEHDSGRRTQHTASACDMKLTQFPSLPPLHADNPSDWPPFFKMPVLMLMLITLLNDGTLISIGYDTYVTTS